MLAMTPAIFVLGAMPPTIMPMLKIEIMTKIYPPRKPEIEPRN